MTWKQFSVYAPGCRNKGRPEQVLHHFLPRFISAAAPRRWHVFFEPSALVRIDADDPEVVLRTAERLARECHLDFERGDCSREWTNPKLPASNTEDYDEIISDAKARFFQGASEMAIEVAAMNYDAQGRATRMLVHVVLNTLGMTYFEEAGFCKQYADGVLELARKYHRQ